MVGTTMPTPLYPLYQRELGFGGLMVTVVFATYAVGVGAAPDAVRRVRRLRRGQLASVRLPVRPQAPAGGVSRMFSL